MLRARTHTRNACLSPNASASASAYCFVAAITTCGYGSKSGTLTIRT
jgi:hypothetical protein